MSVPAYILEKPDIMNDSVQEICEKLAFKAHGKKFIVGLWEAPAPAVVNPLSVREVTEWDTTPMSVSYEAPKHKFVGKSGRLLSSRKDWATRGIGNTFFGYTSESPSAQLFRENAPIGPVSKAVKAAGEIAAVAEAEGEDSKPIWDLVQKVWKIDVSTVKNYVVPDVSKTSSRDIIKFNRRSNHMLYGFDGNNTQCKVELGHYRPETISASVYTDWHRLSLSLRWLGEYISKYQPHPKGKVKSLKMAPVFCEMPKLVACKIIPDLTVALASETPDTALSPIYALAATTMAYYTGTIENYDVKPYVQSAHTVIRALDTEEWGMDSIRDLVSQSEPSKKRMGEYIPRGKPDAARNTDDIYSGKRQRKFGWKQINELEFSHQMSGKGALKLVLEAVYRGSLGHKTAYELRELSDWRHALAKGDADTIGEIMAKVIKALPADTGGMTYKLLEWGSVSKSEAERRYLDMIFELAGGMVYMTSTSKTGLLFEALSKVRDLDPFMNLLRSAIASSGDYIQSKKAIQFRRIPGARASDVVLDAVDRYVAKKLKFWETQYGARIHQAKVRLEALIKDAADEKEMVKMKHQVITYSTLKAWYSAIRVSLDSELRVKLSWPVNWAHQWYEDTGRSYMAKRRKFKENVELGQLQGVRRFNRHLDMAKYMDKLLEPPVKFESLYKLCEQKTRVTRTSIEKTVRARILDLRHVSQEEDPDEEDMTQIDPVPMDQLKREMHDLGFIQDNTPDLVVVAPEAPARTSLALFEDMFASLDDSFASASDIDFNKAPVVDLQAMLYDQLNVEAAIIDISRVMKIDYDQVRNYPLPSAHADTTGILTDLAQKLHANRMVREPKLGKLAEDIV